MNKHIFLCKKSLIVALLWAMACITATAQYGFTPLDGSCINSDGTTSYQFHISLPGNAPLSTYNNVSITAIGGIEIDNVNNNYNIITIKSKTGVESDFGYPKYAKGRISISCEAPADSACSAACPFFNPYYSYSYDVYKSFPLTPDLQTGNPIVGPICIVTGDTVTYSVKPWVSIDKAGIGIDNYKWILPPTLTNNILYYSADSSSITFVVDQLTGADTIKAQIGRCNIGDASKMTWLALNQAVAIPEIDSVSCLAGGIRTVTFRVKNPVSGVTYTWTCDKHWRIDGNSIGDTVNIITDDYNPANVTVTAGYAGGGCTPSSANLFVTRSLGSSSYITPVTCFVAGTQRTFSVNNAPSNSTFVWNLPDGWTPVGDQTGQSINAIPSTSAKVLDSIKVAVTGCESNQIKENVYVIPGSVSTINGTTFCVEKDLSYTFSIDATQPAANSYTWTMSGWNIVSGQGTTSVTAIPTGSIGTISVTPVGLGCNAAAKTTTVAYVPAPPTGITPPACINVGMADTITLSVSPANNEHYEWNIPASFGTIQSYNGTSDSSSVVIYTTGVENSYQILVRAHTSCGYSSWDTTTVSIQGAFSITTFQAGLKSRYAGVTTYPISGATYYEWYVDDVLFAAGEDEPEIYFPNTTSGTVYVIVSFSSGCTTIRKLSWGSKGAPAFNSQAAIEGSLENINDSKSTDINVFPNPVKDILTIILPEEGTSLISLVTIDGKLVKREQENSLNVELNVSDITNGNYVVAVSQNGNKYSKQIIIKK